MTRPCTIRRGEIRRISPRAMPLATARPAVRGYTLIEMLMVLAIVAGLAAIAVPILSDNDRPRLIAASMILTSDIETAQVHSIAVPNEPVGVQFGFDRQSYWLAPSSNPGEPMDRPDMDAPYHVIMGSDRAAAAEGVYILRDDLPNHIHFNPYGGLEDSGRNPEIVLSFNSSTHSERIIRITISPTTGTMRETYERNTGTP